MMELNLPRVFGNLWLNDSVTQAPTSFFNVPDTVTTTIFPTLQTVVGTLVMLQSTKDGDTESHADGVAQRGEVVTIVRVAAYAMHCDGAVWHDEQAVPIVRAFELGDHRRRPGMGWPQLLGNDVRTLDALMSTSDDLRGADVDRHAHAHDAPVFSLVQGYGMPYISIAAVYESLARATTVRNDCR